MNEYTYCDWLIYEPLSTSAFKGRRNCWNLADPERCVSLTTTIKDWVWPEIIVRSLRYVTEWSRVCRGVEGNSWERTQRLFGIEYISKPLIKLVATNCSLVGERAVRPLWYLKNIKNWGMHRVMKTYNQAPSTDVRPHPAAKGWTVEKELDAC